MLSHHIRKLGLGIFSYVYSTYSPSGLINLKIIGNYPHDWVCAYERDKMYKADPVILNASKRRSPFFWCDSCLYNWNDEIFNHSSEYGIDQGYTIPFHDPGFAFGSFHIASCKDDKDFMEIVRSKLKVLYIIAHLTHESFPTLEISTTKSSLTDRETEVLYWSSQGKTYGEISLILKISERTIKFHARNIMEKLNTSNIRQAISTAIRNGYL